VGVHEYVPDAHRAREAAKQESLALVAVRSWPSVEALVSEESLMRDFIAHEDLLDESNGIAYAGMCFDEPEEGDRIEIDGAPYEYLGIAVEHEQGHIVERFGWWSVWSLYAHPPVFRSF
jgi:hypothetical protein